MYPWYILFLFVTLDAWFVYFSKNDYVCGHFQRFWTKCNIINRIALNIYIEISMSTNEKIIIYQVFTRLFGNNNTRCKYNGSMDENGCGKMADFTTKALNEIKNLGATHIWYTGIIEHATQTNYSRYGIRPDHPAVVKGKAGSPYAIKDY